MPITDEKAPKDSDFELLIRRLWDVPLNAALMFNCQMGRGRTTTGGECDECDVWGLMCAELWVVLPGFLPGFGLRPASPQLLLSHVRGCPCVVCWPAVLPQAW